jgi:hypothetical protein
MAMDQGDIVRFIATAFPGVDADVGSKESGAPEMAWGDTFFIYDPDRGLEGAKRFRSRPSSRRTTATSR